MSRRDHLILCGRGTVAPKVWRGWGDSTVRLDATPVTGNVRLQLRDVASRMVAKVPRIAEDLVEVAAYVYAADQASERGSVNSLDYGRAWRRRFRFVVPVRELDVWRDPRVSDEMVRTLSFLSDDDYEVAFVEHRSPSAWDEYLEFEPEVKNVGDIEEVVLFSGGLDSLAGAVDEVLVHGRKVALVSHRPVTKVDHRQWTLANEITKRTDARHAPFPVPVVVNKKEYLGRDFTQRTRSFLFASFAGIVAEMFGLQRIRFYENGIVSCNLPISAQVLGGRASRTTHPRVLNGFQRLLTLLFGKPFVIENPFIFKTRTDVLDALRASGHAVLAARSVSCAHTWKASTDQPHCGSCSQCVDRRLATLAAQFSDTEDPQRRYRVNLLTDALDDVLQQTMVERIIGTAREVARIDGPDQFLRRFGEVGRILGQLPGTAHEAAVQLLELHRRHARQINAVVDQALASRFREGRWDDLAPTSLIRMLAGRTVGGAGTRSREEELLADFTPARGDWDILEALYHSMTRLAQVDLETKSGVSRRTISKRLPTFVRMGIVDYPEGSRKGIALTLAGRTLFEALRARKKATKPGAISAH